MPELNNNSLLANVLDSFRERVEEVYSKDFSRAYSLLNKVKGSEVNSAILCGEDDLKSLIYDACCDQAWEEVRKEWLSGKV